MEPPINQENKKISDQKTFVVTGGTRGIGRAVSLDLARAGHRVFSLYVRNKEAAESVSGLAEKENLEIYTVKGDLSKKEGISTVCDELFAKCDHIDGLVHCAASGVHRKVDELTPKHLRWTMEINVFAFYELYFALKKRFKDGARMVALTSSGGTRALPFYTSVGTSKGALESLVRHMAVELSPSLTVNLVCPGLVETDAVTAFPERETRVSGAKEGTPSGRLTSPVDVARLVHFLMLEPSASQIVGQTLTMDGGKCIKA